MRGGEGERSFTATVNLRSNSSLHQGRIWRLSVQWRFHSPPRVCWAAISVTKWTGTHWLPGESVCVCVCVCVHAPSCPTWPAQSKDPSFFPHVVQGDEGQTLSIILLSGGTWTGGSVWTRRPLRAKQPRSSQTSCFLPRVIYILSLPNPTRIVKFARHV